MTTPIQISRYDRLVRRLMNIVGEGAIVTGALPDVFPVIELENVPVELLALGGWKISFAGDFFTAAAGQFPVHQVFNPIGSGQLVVVTACIVSSTTTARVSWRTTNTARPTLVRQFRWADTRFGFTNSPIELRRETSVLAVVLGSTSRVPVDIPTNIFTQGGEFVLFPGSGLEVGRNQAAVQLVTAFQIRERPFEASEDNF